MCERFAWHASACGAGIKIQRTEDERKGKKRCTRPMVNQDGGDLLQEGGSVVSQPGSRRNIEREVSEKKGAM